MTKIHEDLVGVTLPQFPPPEQASLLLPVWEACDVRHPDLETSDLKHCVSTSTQMHQRHWSSLQQCSGS